MPVDDVEMIRVLAEKVMGAIPTRDERFKTTRYSPPDRSFMFSLHDPDSPYISKHEGWNPFTSWGDAGMLLDKMRLSEDFDHFDHFREALRAQAKDAGWHPGRAFEWWFAECSNRPEAIAMAAYRAVTEGKDTRATSHPVLCSDCPPDGYPTDKPRCIECPRAPWSAS